MRRHRRSGRAIRAVENLPAEGAPAYAVFGNVNADAQSAYKNPSIETQFLSVMSIYCSIVGVSLYDVVNNGTNLFIDTIIF